MGLYHCAIKSLCHDTILFFLVLNCWKPVVLSLTDPNLSKIVYICLIWPNLMPNCDEK